MYLLRKPVEVNLPRNQIPKSVTKSRKALFAGLLVAGAIALLPSCMDEGRNIKSIERDPTFIEQLLETSAIEMRTDDKKVTNAMIAKLRVLDKSETFLTDLSPILPFANAIYYSVIIDTFPENLYIALISEEDFYAELEVDESAFQGYTPYYDLILSPFWSWKPGIEEMRLSYWMLAMFHEIGHAHDDLVLYKDSSEFTADFFGLYLTVLSDASIPLLTSEQFKDLQDFRYKQAIFIPVISGELYGFGSIWLANPSPDPEDIHLLGAINTYTQLAKYGNFKDALQAVLDTPVEELTTEATKTRTLDEIEHILHRAIEVICKKLRSGSYGEKKMDVPFTNGGVLEGYSYINFYEDYLKYLITQEKKNYQPN